MKKQFIAQSAVSTILVLLLAGCGQGFAQKAPDARLAADVQGGLGCKGARSEVFNAYYNAYKDGGSLDPKALTAKATSDISPEVAPQLRDAVKVIHDILKSRVETLSQKAQATNEDEGRDPVLHLIRLEMRSSIDPVYVEMNERLDKALVEATLKAEALGLPCQPAAQSPPPIEVKNPDVSGRTGKLNGALAGARFTMATAYQSCRVLDLPPLNASTRELEGVKKGAAIDDVGWGREYTDVALLKQTDYYLVGQNYPQPCFNQDKNPLVYDYGGVPVIKSSSTLSLFENSGGGTALGIDCSAFISTSVGVAGHRYNAETSNKPVYTRFVSRDFIDPKKSGWDCYDTISVAANSFIAAGDIGAVEGHIVMVDTVGSDPFGLNGIKNAADCDSVSSRKFDFTLIQSSSSKNSIGINRYVAKDYLGDSGKMKTMFEAYAKAACKSKFDGVAQKPNTGKFGIIRHKTSARCQAPGLTLVGESCIASCVN